MGFEQRFRCLNRPKADKIYYKHHIKVHLRCTGAERNDRERTAKCESVFCKAGAVNVKKDSKTLC